MAMIRMKREEVNFDELFHEANESEHIVIH